MTNSKQEKQELIKNYGQDLQSLQNADWLTVELFCLAWHKTRAAVHQLIQRDQLEAVRIMGEKELKICNWKYREQCGLITPLDIKRGRVQDDTFRAEARQWLGEILED